MIYEAFHRLVFPGVVVSIVGSVWITAWSHAVVAEATKGSWPALPVPHHKDSSQPEQNASGQTDPSVQKEQTVQKDPSLQKVLLKNDQIVGVR